MKTEKPLLPQSYTPEVLAKLRKEWTPKERASAFDMRLRDIEQIGDLTFLEGGVLILEFEKDDALLCRELGYSGKRDCSEHKGGQHHECAFTSWMNSGRVKGSRSKRYAARAAVLAMIEINVPLEKAAQLPRGSLQVLSQVPKKQREKFLDAAPGMEVEQLRDKVERECPDAHVEGKSPMRLNPDRSQRRKIDEVLEWAMRVFNVGSREQALEFVLLEWREWRESSPSEEQPSASL